jgi:alpha-L-fucosidase 2
VQGPGWNFGLVPAPEIPFRAESQGEDAIVATGRSAPLPQAGQASSGVNVRQLLKMLNEGGTIRAVGAGLEVNDADAVTLLLAINTDYDGRNVERACREQIEAARKQTVAALREAHVRDHQRLYRRASLDLGAAPDEPTDARLARRRQQKLPEADPSLDALLFHFGRYLMIAGSRENSPLPMTFQGIWSDRLWYHTVCSNDFHLDPDTQMNYWPAEVCNLPECHQPLFRLIQSLVEPGRRTAKVVYGCRGWVAHVFTNAWGFTGTSVFVAPACGTWLALHLWTHYEFTRDESFLAGQCYPVLKESAEFFLDHLTEHPKYGWLVTGPSWSPENRFTSGSLSMGPTVDIATVRELFRAVIEASERLGVDTGLREQVKAALAKLPPFQIGRHGQLMEWLEDFEEADVVHRHTSHLVGLYPYAQIGRRTTPALAKAAMVSYQRRLLAKNPQEINLTKYDYNGPYAGMMMLGLARLGEAEWAHAIVGEKFRRQTFDNLLISHCGSPFATVNETFAMTAGIAEMLVQSHAGEIELLPALPKGWPTGSVKGLRARDGFEVDVAWSEGKLTKATIRSITGTRCRVRYGDTITELQLKPGEVRVLQM